MSTTNSTRSGTFGPAAQTHGTNAERRNVIAALAENLARKNCTRAGFGHRINVVDAVLKYSSGHEYRWTLIDYRNENHRMATVTMDCKAAFRLNRRLQGTGLGFGRIE